MSNKLSKEEQKKLDQEFNVCLDVCKELVKSFANIVDGKELSKRQALLAIGMFTSEYVGDIYSTFEGVNKATIELEIDKYLLTMRKDIIRRIEIGN